MRMKKEAVVTQRERQEIIIDMPPCNSSGDVYHVLSYLHTLSEKDREGVFVWVYTDGSATSDKQYARIVNFAKAIGLGQLFVQKQIALASFYQARREDGTLEYALQAASKDKDIVRIHLHQRATTLLLAAAVKQQGRERTTTHLREAYGFLDEKELDKLAPDQKSKDLITHYVDKSLAKINVSLEEGQPLLILHIRHVGAGKGINDIQNLPDDFVKKFGEYLAAKTGYQVWYIFADDRTTQSFTGITKHRISPFAGKWAQLDDKDKDKAVKSGKAAKAGKAPIKEIFDGFYKLLHLHLLLKLFDEGSKLRLKGIIGNTSGTLDLAAFIGHNVYNLHTFTQPKVNYQDCRLLIQMYFMIIESFNEGALTSIQQDKGKRPYLRYEWTNDDAKAVLKNFLLWEKGQEAIPTPDITFGRKKMSASDDCMQLLCYRQYANGEMKQEPLEHSEEIFNELISCFDSNLTTAKLAPHLQTVFGEIYSGLADAKISQTIAEYAASGIQLRR